ncbi:MAG TPA: hypothetical protein PK167_09240 [Prolixibacteraceae bacterium]|nr:hypothetical protein [Prolixibacteraceae bacterium]
MVERYGQRRGDPDLVNILSRAKLHFFGAGSKLKKRGKLSAE